MEDNTSNPYLLSSLYHAKDICRYINYSVDPHWSYSYWFPPDLPPGPPTTATEWPVQGSRANPTDYWRPLRQQYLHNPALPSGEDHQTRNHLLIAPLGEGPFAPVFAPAFWWGQCRFQVQDITPPTSYTLDSTSIAQWAFARGTASFGASISLTANTGETEIIAEYTLGQFTAAPYLYTNLCDRIGVTWSTNVASVNVYLIDPDGEMIFLTSTTGTTPRPITTDRVYAGSWAQNFGQSIAADTGTDLIGSGTSASSMSDPQHNVALGLMGGWGAVTLHFEITPTDPTMPCTLGYPTFYSPAGPAGVIPETGQAAAMLYADGPGLRWGQWNVWDSGSSALRPTPAIRPPGQKATVLDWLIWKRLLLQGVSETYGLDTEIASLYDSNEAGGRGDLASGTIAALIYANNVAGRALLVNTYAETPPLACFPLKARDATTLQQTGSWAQEAWAYDQEACYYISAQTAAKLYQPGTPRTLWTSAASGGPAGWKVTSHNHIVTNNETANFFVNAGKRKDVANVTPWHGYFLVFAPTPVCCDQIFCVDPVYFPFVPQAGDHTRLPLEAWREIPDVNPDSSEQEESQTTEDSSPMNTGGDL